jgi:hypothetical protein
MIAALLHDVVVAPMPGCARQAIGSMINIGARAVQTS